MTATRTPSTQHVELDIGGMTCASCAARIEKKLNRIEGVAASVNFATERATADVGPDVPVEALIEAVEAAGYTATLPQPTASAIEQLPNEADELAPLRTRLQVSAALALPVVLLSMIPALQFDHWQWLSLTLASPVVVWGAAPFHRATWTNLRHAAATMDTLISVGTLAAYGWSLYALFFGDAGDAAMRMGFDFTIQRNAGTHEIYLEVASGVVVFLLLGRYLEARAKRRSGAALRELLALGSKDVAVLREGSEIRIPIDQLVVGDRFVVRPGEKVATDGIVEDGRSAIDASLLTGESVPVDVSPGDEVTGATVNAGGRLIVRATHVGADTALAQIGRLVTEAQAGKAQIQRLADRVAAVFVPVVLCLAAATLGFWLGAGDGISAAITAAVAVLIIACPCALGLATPTALLVGTTRGAQLGILIKGPETLESTRHVDTIVLDKTGTVTTGHMALTDVVTAPDVTVGELLRLTASLEDASEHPIARAIVEGARERGASLAPVESFGNSEGLGVQGVVEGHAVIAGREKFVADWGLVLPPALRESKDVAESLGHTPVVVAWDGAIRGVVVVADTVRSTSRDAIVRLRALGLHPVLLTGDNERSARAVASRIGIDEVIAEVLPADKVDVVRRLQSEGRVVAMVGDGVNDAAALAQADLGLAMGSGTDVAIEASDLTLMRADLHAAADAVRLSRATLRTIKGNLFWAFGYNIAALPLAASGLLNPLIAGGAMAFSSVFVVSNSLRLRRFSSSA